MCMFLFQTEKPLANIGRNKIKACHVRELKLLLSMFYLFAQVTTNLHVNTRASLYGCVCFS